MNTPEDQCNLWCTAGNAACEAGDYAYALQCYDKAAAADPSDARVDYERAVTLERMGRELEAEKLYRACLQRWPTHDMALTNLGSILRSRNQFDEAITLLSRAVAANPAREEAWFHLGMCHRTQARLGPAADALERAVKLKPTDATDWHWLGVVMQDARRFREALICFAAARTFSSNASEIAFCTHRSGMCGQQAAMGTPRPDPKTYRLSLLAYFQPSDRAKVIKVITSDFEGAIEFLRPQGAAAAVAAVEQEIASLKHAIA